MKKLMVARGKRRVGPLLLVLVCLWSLTVFLTVDLFLNAHELDRVRPQARFYRAMRSVGHKMVGEPYLEDDEFGRGPKRVRRVASSVPTRVAATPGSEARAFLESIGSQGPQEIEAFLGRLQDRPDPALADALLEARSQIPDDLLGDYALAAASAVAGLRATEEKTRPGRSPREILTGLSGDLTLAALEAQSRHLAGDPIGLESNDWRAARVTLERIAWVAPGYERVSPFVEALDPARTSLDRFLEAAAEVGPGSEAEVEALHLASLVGDENTAEICLRFLRRRPPGKPALTREAFLVEEHAFRTVMHRGNAQHRTELERWLSKTLAQARGAEAQRYMERLQRLIHSAGSAPAIRDLVSEGYRGGNHPGSGR